MNEILEAIAACPLTRRTGTVVRLAGLAIEADGPAVAVGDLCEIRRMHGLPTLMAQVVGATPNGITLMPFGELTGVGAGCLVVATGKPSGVRVGEALLGRVIDAFGMPLDGRSEPVLNTDMPLLARAPGALDRPRIERVLETGVRAIDGLLTLGEGQRIGIFAGSGVGKSTLLGMMCRTSCADVNVVALIGERGREVREFIEKQLGAGAMQRSVVVVATADQPALARLRASYAAVAIAEYFRSLGRNVLLMMDSVTRFAMARREVGLAAGEPPTARGYTPSVFAEIPELCERCGTAPGGGAITGLFTVLVDGDDFNEPVADALRATLDGHIVLSRALAQRGHFPAIDVLASVSRVASDVSTKAERALAADAFEQLAVHEKNRQLVDIGAYQRGANPSIDRALDLAPRLTQWLRQAVDEATGRADAIDRLARILDSASEIAS